RATRNDSRSSSQLAPTAPTARHGAPLTARLQVRRTRSNLPSMAVEAGLDAKRIQELDKQYVLHSWSVQNQIQPLPIAGGEGRYFWDHDGNRYLDFASQLVNVATGSHPRKVVAAIKGQAEKLPTIAPPMAHEA